MMSGHLWRGEQLLHQAALVGAQGVEFLRLRGDPGVKGGETVGDCVLLRVTRYLESLTKRGLAPSLSTYGPAYRHIREVPVPVLLGILILQRSKLRDEMFFKLSFWSHHCGPISLAVPSGAARPAWLRVEASGILARLQAATSGGRRPQPYSTCFPPPVEVTVIAPHHPQTPKQPTLNNQTAGGHRLYAPSEMSFRDDPQNPCGIDYLKL